MNKLQDFARLVLRMRRAQKDFKKYNTRAQQSKVEQLEREVDIELEKMTVEGQKIKQMGLDLNPTPNPSPFSTSENGEGNKVVGGAS